MKETTEKVTENSYTQVEVWYLATKDWRGLAECYAGNVITCTLPNVVGLRVENIEGYVKDSGKIVGHSWIEKAKFDKWLKSI